MECNSARWRLEQVGDKHSKRAQIANIALKDAMILPYDANPVPMEFSERTMIASWSRRYDLRPIHAAGGNPLTRQEFLSMID